MWSWEQRLTGARRSGNQWRRETAGGCRVANPECEMEILKVENLSKRYGKTLSVRELYFSIECGEVVGFLVQNGAG